MESKTPDDEVAKLINSLREQRDWVAEIRNLTTLIDKLNNLGLVASTRSLASVVKKSKSWVGVSLILAKGLKLYPEIEKLHSRNEAYVYLLKKNKLRRFLTL